MQFGDGIKTATLCTSTVLTLDGLEHCQMRFITQQSVAQLIRMICIRIVHQESVWVASVNGQDFAA